MSLWAQLRFTPVQNENLTFFSDITGAESFMNRTSIKTAYPWLYLICVAVGAIALFLPLANASAATVSVLILPIAPLVTNIFAALWTVTATEIRSVQRPNPRARLSADEPKTVEGHMFHVPSLPVFLSLLGALVTGFLTESPLLALFIFFLGGALGYALALCILYRTGFAFAMQIGLIFTSLSSILAGVIQVFLSSPSHSFSLSYCYDAALSWLQWAARTSIDMLKTSPVQESQALLEQLNGIDVNSVMENALNSFLSVAPAMFAIVALALCCLIWWIVKALLKRTTAPETAFMERVDHYVPSRVTSILYLIFFLVYLFGGEDSAFRLMGMNVFEIVSAVLAFAGFSFVLYIINTHARPGFSRVLLVAIAIIVGLSSCGMQILILAGLLNAGRDLRPFLGGETLK